MDWTGEGKKKIQEQQPDEQKGTGKSHRVLDNKLFHKYYTSLKGIF